jgi:hypothetical protein
VIRAIAGEASVLWFHRDKNGRWQSHGDDCVKLAHDFVNRTFELLDATGTKWVFHSFDSSLPRQTQGRLKRLVSPDGRPITLEYSQADAPSHIGWTSPEGDAMEMSYEYRETSDFTPRVTQATLVINRFERVRLHYQFNQLDMLHSITKEAAKNTDWTTEFQVTFWYGAEPAHPHGPPLLDRLEYLNLQEDSPQSTTYQIRYSKNGRVKWVHSEGPGPKPVYLD